MNIRSRGAVPAAAAIGAVLLSFTIFYLASAGLEADLLGTSPSPSASESPEWSPAASVDPGSTVVVEAGDLWFAPDEIAITSGGPTTFVLVGVGNVAHNLVVDELGLQLAVGPGSSADVTVSDLAPGTYEFYCSIFGHRRGGMLGTLTIE